MWRILTASLSLAATFVLAGCLTPSGSAPPDQFLLRPAPLVEKADTVGLNLGLRPVEAARPFQLAMAYSEPDGRLNYYQSASWADYPAKILTRSLQEALDQSGRFGDVGMAAEMTRPDLILVGYLSLCHENRASNTAELEVRFELRRALRTELLWASTLKESEPLTGQGPAALASALQSAMSRLVQQAATEIIGAAQPLSENP